MHVTHMHRSLGVAGLLLALPLTGLAAQAAGATRPRSSSVGRTRAPGPLSSRFPGPTKDGRRPAPTPRTSCGATGGRRWFLPSTPRDFTNGCTAEMQTFADQYDTLFGPDVVVLGVSADSLETPQALRRESGPAVPAAERPRPHRSPASTAATAASGRAKRTVFVIGPDGRVKYRNMKFNALDPKHYSALGSAVEAARGG